LTAVAGGNVDTTKWDEGLRKAVAITNTVPSLTDEARKMLRDAGRPRLIPLVMAREHQRQIVDEAQQLDLIITRRIVSSHKIVEAYTNERKALIKTRSLLNEGNQKPWQTKSLSMLNKDLSPKEKRLLYELLGEYFDDVPRFQSEQRFWEYRRLATYYEESIERSKTAAVMWQNLLDGVTNTLAAFHSSGIKTEEIALLLQSLGIVAVGVGVNR
jgi:hypothetical protein